MSILILLVGLFQVPAIAYNSKVDHEQQVKAAFLYNFINFIDWPVEKMPENNDPIVIGIVGNKDFTKAFDPIKERVIRNKKIEIKYFEQTNGLETCHVVYICKSRSTQATELEKVFNTLKTLPVLAVGEETGFLEHGGDINFLKIDGQIRFEINLNSIKENRLDVRSKLLKLAKRVINEKPGEKIS